MRHLAEHTADIETLFGGHEDFPATIIGEMIELLEKVVAGTDDRAEYTVPFPPGSQSTVYFGAAMKSFYRRVDGKDANVQYAQDPGWYGARRVSWFRLDLIPGTGPGIRPVTKKPSAGIKKEGAAAPSFFIPSRQYILMFQDQNTAQSTCGKSCKYPSQSSR